MFQGEGVEFWSRKMQTEISTADVFMGLSSEAQVCYHL